MADRKMSTFVAYIFLNWLLLASYCFVFSGSSHEGWKNAGRCFVAENIEPV